MSSASARLVERAFRHEAVFYDGLDELVASVASFVRDGLQADEPVLVAELPEQLRALQAELGSDADRVAFLDMAEVGRNPACIIPVWREFVEHHRGKAVRGVGEPAWTGRRRVELEECQLHEALLNVAFDGEASFRLLCPYDVRRLPENVVTGAMRTHPEVGPDRRRASYGGHEHAVDVFSRPLPPPPADLVEHRFGAGDLAGLRRDVRGLGARVIASPDVLDDLVLAVHELAANSVEHGGGGGVLRAWTQPDGLVLEVSDRGVIDDPLIGREPALAVSESGRGIWMANHLCDLVQVRSSANGTTVRLHSWL